MSPYLKTSYSARLELLATPFRRWAAIGALATAAVLPFVFDTYYLSLLNLVLIACIGAIGINITTGYAGQVNFGQAGFLLVGEFVAGAIAIHIGAIWANFWIAAPAAMIAGAAVGVIVGWPALRVRGLYVTLATLAAFIIIQYLGLRYIEYLQQTLKTGVDIKLSALDLLFMTVSSERSWYYLLLSVTVVVIVAATGLAHTKAGRAWQALREHELMTEVMGINVAHYKLIAFAVGASLASLAGMLFGFYHHSVNPEAFTVEVSVQYLAMIIIGGMGSIAGAVLGAAFVVLIPYGLEWLLDTFDAPSQFLIYFSALRLGVFAFLMLAFLLLEPEGLIGLWGRIRRFFVLWPFRFQPLEEKRR